MAAVKVSDIRAAVRINLEDPLRWNEVTLGIGASSQPNQHVYQLPTFPVSPLSEVLSINAVTQVRGTDYTITNETGQIYYATTPVSGSIVGIWQWSRWADTQLNQWIAEATRILSLYVPKLAKIQRKVAALDVTNQGWFTDPNTLRIYKVRSFDPSQPIGSDLLWQEIPYWSWDDPDHFLRLNGTFLVGDQFQHLERRRWKDPDVAGDSMDPGQSAVVTADGNATVTTSEEAWPIDFNDPVSWLVASLALEKEESPRDIAGLEGNVLDAQVTPMGGFVKDAAVWRKKFSDWLAFYRGAKYTQRPRREPYIL